MKLSKPEFVKRKSVWMNIVGGLFHKEGDFIEVTEWTNREGVDIVIAYGANEKRISLTHEEIDAIKMTTDILNSIEE